MIRPMQVWDLDVVMEIEKVAYSTPWTRNTFQNELQFNTYSHYLTAWQEQVLVAYGGIWKVLDEAHITNVAVHPDYRGQGYGKVILSALLYKAKQLGVVAVTLEVRESNHIAKRLYEKNGFEYKGRRKNYYSDNNEDALIMWKEDLSDVALAEGCIYV